MTSIFYTVAMGSIANCTEMLLGQVPDRIKTEMQKDPSLTTKNACKTIWQRGGAKELYSGASLNMVQAATKGGFRWGINAFNDRLFGHYLPSKIKEHYPALFTLLIASSSAVLDGTVTNLTDRAKTFKMSLEDKSAFWPAVRRKGVSFFFEGWMRSCIKQMTIWISFQLSYNYLKRTLEGREKKPLTPIEKVFLAVIPGIVGAFSSTLPDLLKTQKQMERPLNKNLLQSVAALKKQYGYWGLFRSAGVKGWRSGQYAGVTWGIMYLTDALPPNMRIK